MADKLAFRSIGEVSDLLKLRPHVLRYWEKQFPQIKPVKRAGGRRYYREEDILLIRRVDDLVHRQGYTLRGARRVLAQPARSKADLAGRAEVAGLLTDAVAGDAAYRAAESKDGTAPPSTPIADAAIEATDGANSSIPSPASSPAPLRRAASPDAPQQRVAPGASVPPQAGAAPSDADDASENALPLFGAPDFAVSNTVDPASDVPAADEIDSAGAFSDAPAFAADDLLSAYADHGAEFGPAAASQSQGAGLEAGTPQRRLSGHDLMGADTGLAVHSAAEVTACDPQVASGAGQGARQSNHCIKDQPLRGMQLRGQPQETFTPPSAPLKTMPHTGGGIMFGGSVAAGSALAGLGREELVENLPAPPARTYKRSEHDMVKEAGSSGAIAGPELASRARAEKAAAKPLSANRATSSSTDSRQGSSASSAADRQATEPRMDSSPTEAKLRSPRGAQHGLDASQVAKLGQIRAELLEALSAA